MIRELVLQLKRGSVRPKYFFDKYGVNILERFADPLREMKSAGYMSAVTDEIVALTRDGLLRVDVLLRGFFLPQHTGIRYT
jgi:oxygen-independent coproporphyrinogen-3 oxidase